MTMSTQALGTIRTREGTPRSGIRISHNDSTQAASSAGGGSSTYQDWGLDSSRRSVTGGLSYFSNIRRTGRHILRHATQKTTHGDSNMAATKTRPSSASIVKHLAPVLIVDDVKKCIDFWVDRFGF